MAEPVTNGDAGGSQNTIPKQPWETLGYSSFDEYDKSLKAEAEKLRKQAEDRQAMIDRQANELGELRKRVNTSAEPQKPSSGTPPAPPQGNADDEVEREAKKRLDAAIVAMTPEQQAKLEEAFSKATPEVVASVKQNAQTRLIFMQHALGEEAPKPKVSFFDGLIPEKRETAAEKLKRLLADVSDKPIPHAQSRSGVPRPSRMNADDASETVTPHQRFYEASGGGGFMESLAQIKTQQRK